MLRWSCRLNAVADDGDDEDVRTLLIQRLAEYTHSLRWGVKGELKFYP